MKSLLISGVFAGLFALSCGDSTIAVDLDNEEENVADMATTDDASGPKSDTFTDMTEGENDASQMEDADIDPGMDADPTTCSTGSRDGICVPTAECGAGMESIPGRCPGPADIQCCVPIDDSICLESPSVDEMPQPNVGLSEAPGVGGCPDGMIPIETFCVDQYEAALIEVLNEGTERPWSPYHNPGSRRVRAVSIEAAVPQSYISGDQAAAACAEAGKRLCSDSEWQRACRGANNSVYPYGDARQPDVCNDSRSRHPAVDYFESSDDSIWSMLDNACIGQQDDTVEVAGAHTGCVSDDGAYDMMGNLHEWTSASSGTFRGGFYADTSINGDGCLYRTTAHSRAHWDYSTGFRCCSDR